MLTRFTAIHRFISCVLAAALMFFTAYWLGVEVLTRVMLSWDAFSVVMLTASWITFFKTGSDDIRKQAKGQDDSRYVIFTIVLAAVVISLLGILILLRQTDEKIISRDLHFPVSILGVGLSWLLLHTIFTLRYAHLYYGDNLVKPLEHCGGINFPEDDKPDFLDFAYFAFVIGMTFQVSDAQVTGKHIRRIVLLHGLISFGFNTVVVALSVGIIAGLKK